MVELLEVECPVCAEVTVALTPSRTDPVGTADGIDQTLPDEVDTAVRTTCDNDHEFVVLLQEG